MPIAPVSESTSKRIQWLDAAKGISILLVVFGHVFPPAWGNSILLLRMPFFFFLAGYVFKPRPIADFLWKRVNSLLVPYFVYIIVIGLICLLGVLIGLKEPTASRSVLWHIAQLARGGQYLNPNYFGPLWFLTTLFFALFLYNCILNALGDARSIGVFIAVVVTVIIGYQLEGHRTYLSIGTAPMAMFYVWAGTIYRQTVIPNWVLLPAALLATVAWCLTKAFSFYSAKYGIPILSIMGALAACYLTVVACRYLARYETFVGFFSPIGAASLVIMVMHRSVEVRLRDMLHLPPLVVFPISVIVPMILYTGLRRTGWLSRWLFLGNPPPMPELMTVRRRAADAAST